MHLALYRAERPERFEEIIGQKHIVKILRNQLAKESVSQTYLFTGTRGTGKTTTARILAKAVNCTGATAASGLPCCECENCRSIKEGNFLDVIELDAASNNGVDDIRDLINTVQYPPVMGKYKVYIIDEAHMLSTSAENAFLKTLEEPPEHAIFILATTDPEKIRPTIRSRCMTLNFKRVSEKDLIAGMRRICDKRGVAIDDAALSLIARRADGSVRDSLSILEQCISGGDDVVTSDIVLEYLGSAGLDHNIAVTDSVLAGDIGSALVRIAGAVSNGSDAKQMLSDWLQHFRDLMIVKYVQDAERIIGYAPENILRLRAQADKIDMNALERAIRMLSEYVNMGRYSAHPRLLLETAAIRLANGGDDSTGAPLSRVPRGGSQGGGMQGRPMRNSQRRPQPTQQQPMQQTTSQPMQQVQSVVREEQQSIEVPRSEFVSTFEPQPLSDRMIETGDTFEGDVDFDAMWDRIIDEMTRTDLSFVAMVGNHGRITTYDNDEIVITVKKSKLPIAEGYKEGLDAVVKRLFGAHTFVTLKGGNITPFNAAYEPAARSQNGVSGDADDKIEETETRSVQDVADDLSSVFGIDVKIK